MADACGKCFKVNAQGKTLILKATNYCPPDNPSCANGAAHFDIAAPGFDYPGNSISNGCNSLLPNDHAMHVPQTCAYWPNKGCDCNAISDPTLREGCHNFLSLGWNNPTVSYEEVGCPSELSMSPPCMSRSHQVWRSSDYGKCSAPSAHELMLLFL